MSDSASGEEMPRPPEGQPKPRGFWSRRTQQERLLIVVTSLSVTIIAILVLLVTYNRENVLEQKACNSTICMIEASRMLEYIDPETDPCDNFYQFACGSFLKNAHGDKKLSLPHKLRELAKRELIETYAEAIKESDHKIVKVVKKLFKACINEDDIERDYTKTIQSVLKSLGGWPVVEGATWNENSFDWLSATYKLRELGYFYSVFLHLDVQVDPKNGSRYLYKVDTPYLWDRNNRNYDKVELMAYIAEHFGAEDRYKVMEEMAAANEFLARLQLEIHNWYGLAQPRAFTIAEYQEKSKQVNWLHFIKNITRGKVAVFEKDHVVFPTAETLNSWIGVILKTPKRVQANYMIWKVIENLLPYLPGDIIDIDIFHRKVQNREVFCLGKVQEMFTPSPIDVMLNRKYLPPEKKELIEELLENIKEGLISMLEDSKWPNKKDKARIVERAKNVNVVVGQPEVSSNNTLDDLIVDMIEINVTSFLTLLAQANRNSLTLLYNKINQTPKENLSDKWYIKSAAELPFYSVQDNILFVPTISTQELLYNENRTHYLNYGAFGVQVGQKLANIIIENGERKDQQQCMQKAVADYNVTLNRAELAMTMQQSIGEQLSYSAYLKWVENHGEELPLINCDYTPNQLFWLSEVSTYCFPIINLYSSSHGVFENSHVFSSIISGSLRNNPHFANDFNCGSESKMNPAKRCQLI